MAAVTIGGEVGVWSGGLAVEVAGMAGGVVGLTRGVEVDVATVGALVGNGDGVGERIEITTTSLVAVGLIGVGAWAASMPQPLIKSAARSSKPGAAGCCNLCR
jgi:hypothetical protein